jgi:hypothetical protein
MSRSITATRQQQRLHRDAPAPAAARSCERRLPAEREQEP